MPCCTMVLLTDAHAGVKKKKVQDVSCSPFIHQGLRLRPVGVTLYALCIKENVASQKYGKNLKRSH